MLFVYVVVMFMQKEYTWPQELDSEARKGFREVLQRRLKGMAYDATARDNPGPPKWMDGEMHIKMKKGREDDEFKKRSKQAKLNRRSGDPERPIQPSHRQGSVSSAEYAQRMHVSKV